MRWGVLTAGEVFKQERTLSRCLVDILKGSHISSAWSISSLHLFALVIFLWCIYKELTELASQVQIFDHITGGVWVEILASVFVQRNLWYQMWMCSLIVHCFCLMILLAEVQNLLWWLLVVECSVNSDVSISVCSESSHWMCFVSMQHSFWMHEALHLSFSSSVKSWARHRGVTADLSLTLDEHVLYLILPFSTWGLLQNPYPWRVWNGGDYSSFLLNYCNTLHLT